MSLDGRVSMQDETKTQGVYAMQAVSPLVMKTESLTKVFEGPRRLFVPKDRSKRVTAVNNLSLEFHEGESVGLIGESGSGKTTLGRLLLHLTPATSGRVVSYSPSSNEGNDAPTREFRQDFQMIFQNPLSALNPRHRVVEAITEPLRVHKIGTAASQEARAVELLDLVGLSSRYKRRFPHELSGGQLQRVGIARALATRPRMIVADEPTASLDASVRGQIMNLLKDLKAELSLSSVFISHDLSVVAYLCDRILVMYKGDIVETGTAEEVTTRPQHPYTKRLIAAIPGVNPA